MSQAVHYALVMGSSDQIGSHRAFVRQRDLRMTFDLGWSRFENTPTNLVVPSPTPMTTVSSIPQSPTKRIAVHTYLLVRVYIHNSRTYSLCVGVCVCRYDYDMVIFFADAPEMYSTSDTCHETQQGKNITLHCIAQALPISTITWYFPNGTQVMSHVNNVRESEDTFLGVKLHSEFTILVEDFDEYPGEFTCNASNSVGTESLTFTVTDTCSSK